MNLYNRYLAGETVEVYKDIESLGAAAFLQENSEEVERVLTETFKRVAYNLEIIYTELKAINYKFRLTPEEVYRSTTASAQLVEQLNQFASPFGYIPLSLQFFYKIVGGVNLCWDYENYPEIQWPLSDPLEIDSLDVLVNTINKDWWKDYTQENLEDPDVGIPFVELAADQHHKDNLPGGPPYAVQLTLALSVDSPFLYEQHATSFINYLRICFDNCGFPGIETPSESFVVYRDRVKERLKGI